MVRDASTRHCFGVVLTDEIGYGAATEVVAISAKLHADIARMNAMRKAESHPSLEEDDAEDKAFFRELIAEGFPLDPDAIARTLED